MKKKTPEPCPWLDAGPRGGGLSFDDYPAALLMRAAGTVQLAYTSVHAREHGLSVPEWRILGRLHESAPIQLAALCRVSLFDKAYAGRVLRGLEARGLVAMRIDEAHKRRQIVDITPAGRELAQIITPIARRNQMRLLEVLEPEERRALYQTLRKLLAAAERAKSSTPPRKPSE